MLEIKGGKFYTNGERQDLALGVSAFKLGNRVAIGEESKALRFIEHNQKMLNRERCFFRVLLENGGWSPVPAGQGMFGSPPRDPGMWNVEWLQRHWNDTTKEPRRVKPEHLTDLYRRTLEWFFKTSETTGACFELVIIATLKHTDNVGNGHIDHVIRTTLVLCDELQDKYPRACILMSACNEWDAHDTRDTPAGREKFSLRKQVNMWVERRARDDYWKAKPLIVDHGGRDTFEYECGECRDKYDGGMVHPVRKSAGRDWRKLPDMQRLRADARGMPVGFPESMYFITAKDTTGWYRNTAGWNLNLDDQIAFYSRWPGNIDYGIIHHDKGVQCDPDWPATETPFESAVAELFGGTMPPPPPPEPEEYKLYITGKDPRGHFNVKIEFPEQPASISQGQDYTLKVNVPLPGQCVIYQADSFNGLDRGDIVEMDTFIYDQYGRVLYQRSLHKETPAMYDSFHPLECDAVTDRVAVHMHAHVTKSDEPARAHWNIMLWCREL